MRKLRRVPLPQRVLDALAVYQDALDDRVALERSKAQPEIRGVVDAAWHSRRSTKAIEAVCIALGAMASGLQRCMYCEDSRGSDVEHLRPKATYPGHTFVWPNLLLVCADCNRQKNAAFDETMLDPTIDDPLDHLVLSINTGRYTTRDESKRGAATLDILRRLNSDPDLTRGRRDAVVMIRVLLSEYERCGLTGRDTEAHLIRETLVNRPFRAVFAAVLRAALDPNATEFFSSCFGEDAAREFLAVLSRHPQMHAWLDGADAARIEGSQPRIEELARAVRRTVASNRD